MHSIVTKLWNAVQHMIDGVRHKLAAHRQVVESSMSGVGYVVDEKRRGPRLDTHSRSSGRTVGITPA
jgi:hypothetical protein